jgi:transcriptional regulator GlxA family with amidase domain
MAEKETGPIHVGIVVCPNFAAMDIFGVYTVFGVPPYLGLRPDIYVHLLWKDSDEFSAIPPFPMRATKTFADCPKNLDVLALGALPPNFVDDDEAMDFVAEYGARASYLIGVCAGSLVLGAAGLLKGYRATTNFHALDQLAITGAIPTKGHVVVDRNRYTSGPAVGAYDASLAILGRLCGEEVAREHELHLEHLAEPPFGTGRPDLAGEALTRRALGRLVAYADETNRRLVEACRRREVSAS